MVVDAIIPLCSRGRAQPERFVLRHQAESLHTQILIAQKQEGLRVADEDWWRLCSFEMSLVGIPGSLPCLSFFVAGQNEHRGVLCFSI